MALVKKNQQQTQQTNQQDVKKDVVSTPSNAGGVSIPRLVKPEFGFSDQQRADLWYGSSGSGKTENLGLAALELWEEYGLITRYISADGGGWKTLNPYVNLGIIDPVSINVLDHPLRVVMAMARGYWPVFKEGKTVYQPISQKVIEGDELNGLPPVGGWSAEGLTSFAHKIMNATLKSKDIKVPEQPKDCFVKDGDDEIWFFAGRSNYGFVQQRILELVDNVNTLPFKRIIMTALEDKGVDPETGEQCYGPKVIGKALTGIIPSYFGDCIHLEVVDTGELEDDKRKDYHGTVKGGLKKVLYRAYLTPHPDPKTGHQFKAKSRISSWVNSTVDKYFDIPPFDPENPEKDRERGAYLLYQLESKKEKEATEILRANMKRKPPSEIYALKKGSMIVVPAVDESLKEFEVTKEEQQEEKKETILQEGESKSDVVRENVEIKTTE